MIVDRVYHDTVAYLSKYNLESLIEIAREEFGIEAEYEVTKDELIKQCALVEVNNYVH